MRTRPSPQPTAVPHPSRYGCVLNHSIIIYLYLFDIIIFFCVLWLGGQDEGLCASKLGAFVDALLERPENRRALHGILVGKVSSGKEAPLYARNAASLFTPASNTKLFTTASLFQHTSGAEHFRYATPFLFRRSTSQLCVRGGGDPSLAHADLVGAAAGYRITYVSTLIALSIPHLSEGLPMVTSGSRTASARCRSWWWTTRCSGATASRSPVLSSRTNGSTSRADD